MTAHDGAPVVGLDIGGTKIEAVFLGGTTCAGHAGTGHAGDGHVLASIRIPTRQGDDGVTASALEAVRQVCAAAGRRVADVAHVGAGVPGAVRPGSGVVVHAVNLGVERLDLGARLSDALQVPVTVDNDVNAAALGAHRVLDLPPSTSLAFVNVGTGLAAGLVLGGVVWRGSRGAAGEIGHLPVADDDTLCPCGQRGCAELWASGSGVARHRAALIAERPDRDEQEADAIVRRRLLSQLADSSLGLLLSVDVDVLVVGGGMATAVPGLVGGVADALALRSRRSSFLASLDLASRVVAAPPGPLAAVGAAHLRVVPGIH